MVVSRFDSDSGLPAAEAMRLEIGFRYFTVLWTPLLQGSVFDSRNSLRSSLVSIIDESLAHHFWPDGRAIGSHLVVGDGPPREVVGMVADVGASPRGSPRVPHVYLPFWQNPEETNARYCVRVEGEPAAALPMLVGAVNRMDPEVAVTETMSMATHLAAGDELKAVRMTAAITAYAALLAVLLSAIGIY